MKAEDGLLVVAAGSLGVGSRYFLSRSRFLFYDCYEEGVAAFYAQLVEVGPWHD